MLLFVQLLEIRQRVRIVRIEPQDFRKGFDRAIHEAAAAIVEPQTEQHVGVLEPSESRALQQLLMDLHRPPHLALLAVQIAENHVDLERVGREPRRLAQLLDRQIELVADEEVEPLHVVGRLASPTTIDPSSVFELVALPGFADGESGKEREQDEKSNVGPH